jgi:hypothetical protein
MHERTASAASPPPAPIPHPYGLSRTPSAAKEDRAETRTTQSTVPAPHTPVPLCPNQLGCPGRSGLRAPGLAMLGSVSGLGLRICREPGRWGRGGADGDPIVPPAPAWGQSASESESAQRSPSAARVCVLLCMRHSCRPRVLAPLPLHAPRGAVTAVGLTRTFGCR